MRLLDTRTKQIKTFYGEKIPRYAILSHMWGEEEDEVLLRHIAGSDVDKHEGELRKGYAKIRGACKQAAEDGWEYIWIDTCCIDKESSAELSEAINSMYEWYWNSEVCYVYLEDVRSDGDQPESNQDATFPIVPFERSRWFTRGWTLQELIAPQFVVFYSRDWVEIGTKASLRDTISAVTRIRVEMLMAYDPEKASVAEKMSWAAFRKTTRAEDVAYCLVGLLGVNMPLLYGEGDRAFMRLQEEFMKVSDDDSLFAWKSRLDDYRYQLGISRGMLANSPWEFRDGINIARSKNGAYAPYSMTNQGLQIKLPLLPIDPKRDLVGFSSENIFKTTLKCTIRDRKPNQWIIIYLKKIREGYYQRILPHWLDETKAHPNETELTMLLVSQANTLMTRNRSRFQDVQVEILPTESGFTVDGHILVEGYRDSYDLYFASHKIIYFQHQKKCFGVAIGSNKGIPWLDFIDVINETQSYNNDPYEKKGPRVHVREWHLDRLSEKIPERDWWLTVSVGKTSSPRFPRLRAVIDIQRVPIRAKGWYIPLTIPVGDSLSKSFPGDLNRHGVHPDFKKEGHNWFAIFNPEVKRVLDVDLIYTLLPKSVVHCIQLSCDGKYLATGSDVVQIYDMGTGAEICTFIDSECTEAVAVSSICFSPDSKFVATGDSGGCIKLWDISTKCIHKVLNGHLGNVESLCFSLDGHLLISGSGDSIGRVRIWKIADETSRILVTPHDNYYYWKYIWSISISPNGKLVAAGSPSGRIWIWDVMTTQLLEELPELGDGNGVYVAFTLDGKGLVSGSGADKTLKYWDVSGLVHTGVKRKFEELGSLGASSMLDESSMGKINRHTMTFTGHKTSLTSVAVSHDGRWVISGSDSGHVLFWDLKNATPQLILKIYMSSKSYYPLLGMSPVGNIFATTFGKEDEIIQVWRYNNV